MGRPENQTANYPNVIFLKIVATIIKKKGTTASKILVAMHDDSAHFHNDLLNKASDAIFVMEI